MKPEPRIVILDAGDLVGEQWDPDPIGTALDQLTDRDAYVIRSAYLGERRQPDRVIAAELGIDRSRVTRIRHRALDTLRAHLEP